VFSPGARIRAMADKDQGLLREIERDRLDGKPLADLLRKCVVLGGRAGSPELREWEVGWVGSWRGDADAFRFQPPWMSDQPDRTSGSAAVGARSSRVSGVIRHRHSVTVSACRWATFHSPPSRRYTWVARKV
jgi:AbiTii